MENLNEDEIRHILLAADEIIGSGGRSMLAKILKGSRDKKLLELGLDNNKAYGYYRSLTIEQITLRVDWMIKNDFLLIEYQRDLPLLIFSEKAWHIQRDQKTDLFLLQWDQWVSTGISDIDMTYLKDRNRGMILLFLQKIADTSDERYIPLLKQWESVDYQKVRKVIRDVIAHLRSQTRARLVIEDAPQADIPAEWFHPVREPERLKCRECGKRFNWSVDEQEEFRMRGWDPPKRCLFCRHKRHF